MYEEILQRLEADTTFRERKNKNECIAEILINKYNINASPSRVKAIIEDANSMDRYWRLILMEREDLRGTDYDTKKKVSQQKQIEFGYEVGYHENIKKLKTL